MSSREIVDILNASGEVIGTMSREEAEQNNHVTNNVLIFVFNSFGKVWVQLRPMSKKDYPGLWDISACGGVESGETHQAAAKRETFEETGLNVELHHVETFLNIFSGDEGEERSRLSHLYIGINDQTPQPNNEVDEFKVWQPQKLRKNVERNPNHYVPSFIVELDKAVEGLKKLAML